MLRAAFAPVWSLNLRKKFFSNRIKNKKVIKDLAKNTFLPIFWPLVKILKKHLWPDTFTLVADLDPCSGVKHI
jgi:hypothetical protein